MPKCERCHSTVKELCQDMATCPTIRLALDKNYYPYRDKTKVREATGRSGDGLGWRKMFKPKKTCHKCTKPKEKGSGYCKEHRAEYHRERYNRLKEKKKRQANPQRILHG